MAKRAAGRGVMLGLLCCCGIALAALYIQVYLRRPFEPLQVVPFDHATHTDADKANIPCLACHPGAERAAAAGMPADSTCLDCHRHILAQDPRLLPLHAAANPDSQIYTGEPLRWRRAYPLPAHAHFHHASHTPRYDCARCHPSPGRESPMLMRDCLDCHRDERQPLDCHKCHR